MARFTIKNLDTGRHYCRDGGNTSYTNHPYEIEAGCFAEAVARMWNGPTSKDLPRPITFSEESPLNTEFSRFYLWSGTHRILVTKVSP